MNGERVGEWGTLRGVRAPFFRYEKSWANSPHGRALSLSLPETADREVRGPAVEYYFDNLLPDSAELRSRIRTRFKTRSSDAFDLLTAIGRDCVGAVQLLPPNDEPLGWDRVDAAPLTEEEVERTLRDVTVATPTTHILKLPFGIIGGFRGDFSDSVENEWLCAQVLRELDLPVADAAIARFGEQRALVVTRFDRRWIGVDTAEVQKKRFQPRKGAWIARLPQEDLCQAMGLPHTLRYEADGGPSIPEALGLLANSEHPVRDQTNFVLAQLAFWLLGATDWHGKNFSLHHRTGGTYGMTPLYDVLSAWPIIGHGKNHLAT